MVESSGVLIYRRKGDELSVLLVHPAGNYNRRAPWSIPKGLPDEGESLEQTARRETLEETGVEPGDMTPLGFVDYARSRKRIHAFMAEARPSDQPRVASWEVDRAEFLTLAAARQAIHPEQAPLLDRLTQLLQ